MNTEPVSQPDSFESASAQMCELVTQVESLESDSAELGQIRATLIVNCQPGRTLHARGITYDETKSVLVNVFDMMTKLTAVIQTGV